MGVVALKYPLRLLDPGENTRLRPRSHAVALPRRVMMAICSFQPQSRKHE